MKRLTLCFSIILILLFSTVTIYGHGKMVFPMHHHFMHADNLQIFESPQQAQQAMVHFSESLGEKCNFCHDVGPEVGAESIRKDLRVSGNFEVDYSKSIKDKDLNYKLRQKGSKQAKLFTWERAAKSYIELYKKISGLM